MNNLWSYCGLVDVRINASDKDLPVAHLFYGIKMVKNCNCDENTGKSLTEAFILTSTNPQHDNRLFIDLPVQYMKTTSSERGENMMCAKIVLNVKTKTKNNLCAQHVLLMF